MTWLIQLAFMLARLLPPEAARKLGFWAVKHGLVPRFTPPATAARQKILFGQSVPSLVGLAAGADKNGEAIAGWFKLGFGFVELGSVSYYPWAGNTGQRLWRFGKGLINWYGLNSLGVGVMRDHISTFIDDYGPNCLIGVSLVNPDPDQKENYGLFTKMAMMLSSMVTYFTINFSCPNSQEEMARSKEVLVAQTRATKAGARNKPVLWKLAYIDNDNQLAQTIHLGQAEGISGYVVANTFTYAMAEKLRLFGKETDERLKLWPRDAKGNPIGGYSGPETRRWMIGMIRVIRRADRHTVIIASGGTFSPADVMDYLRAGANAVQLYTSLAKRGPRLMQELLTDT